MVYRVIRFFMIMVMHFMVIFDLLMVVDFEHWGSRYFIWTGVWTGSRVASEYVKI